MEGSAARSTAMRVPFSRNLFPIALSLNCPFAMEKRDTRTSPIARKTTGFLVVGDFAQLTHSEARKTRCGNHRHIAGWRSSFLAG